MKRACMPGDRKRLFRVLPVAGILLFAFFLSFYRFAQNGYGNLYYTAAVKSMTQSWHAFFFLSLDSSGFVSIDKPPLAFWVQAAFVKAFGFHSWALLLPEALETVFSVWILYHLVEKRFGLAAGLLSAAFLSVTPIFIAAAHSNNPDALLVCLMLLSAWAAVRAAETGRFRHLLLTALFIGLAFNTKMLMGFLVLPACLLVCFFARGVRLKRKLLRTAAAAVVLLGVSFCWVAAVDLTPAASRPYVGSSSDNSEVNLVFGYNGFMRVFSLRHFSDHAVRREKRAGTQASEIRAVSASNSSLSATDLAAKQDKLGLFRLFDRYLGEQIGWFLLPAAGGFASAVFWLLKIRKRKRRFPQAVSLLLWGSWAATTVLFFGFCGDLTHRYYLNVAAPALAALSGIGLSCAAKMALRKAAPWREALFLPAILISGAVFQLFCLTDYPRWFAALWPFGAVCLALAVFLFFWFFDRGEHKRSVFYAGFAAAVVCLLAVPFLWSFTTVLVPVKGGDASAGPSIMENKRGVSFLSWSYVVQRLKNKTADPVRSAAAESLEKKLERGQGGAFYLLAVPDAPLAESFILDTGRPVMTIGGFSGGNPILTLRQFQKQVAEGKVRYFLTMSESIRGADSSDKDSEDIPDLPVKRSGEKVHQTVLYGLSSAKTDKNADAAIYAWAEASGERIPLRLTGRGARAWKGDVLYRLSSEKARAALS